jgi:hypothetical protein
MPRSNFDPRTLKYCCSSLNIRRKTSEEDQETFRHPCLQIFPIRHETHFVGSEFALCFFKADIWSSYRPIFLCNRFFCESEPICGAIQVLFRAMTWSLLEPANSEKIVVSDDFDWKYLELDRKAHLNGTLARTDDGSPLFFPLKVVSRRPTTHCVLRRHCRSLNQ